MFTGLIETVGKLSGIKVIGPAQRELTVATHHLQDDLKLGDSVAIDGVCLTVTRFDSSSVAFELSEETLKKTLFGQKKLGSKLNLERALRLGDRLGGHLVQGHVDGQAKLIKVEKSGEFYRLSFSYPPEVARYLIDKGSVALNGISLTLASLASDQFIVAIIPHTYEQTNLPDLGTGDPVHLETDLIGRYVERLLGFKENQNHPSQLTEGFLRSHGF